MRLLKKFPSSESLIPLVVATLAISSAPARAAKPDCEEEKSKPNAPMGRIVGLDRDVSKVTQRAPTSPGSSHGANNDDSDYESEPYVPAPPRYVERGYEESRGGKLIMSLVEDARINQALKDDKALWTKVLETPKAQKFGFSFWWGTDYKDKLKAGLTLKDLYGSYAGTGYTIGEHTSKALSIYDSQKSFYQLQSLKLPAGVGDIDKLMTYTLALHDIGKPIAHSGGLKWRECSFSTPILQSSMKSIGFSPMEIKLAAALVDVHQEIGTMLSRDRLVLSARPSDEVEIPRPFTEMFTWKPPKMRKKTPEEMAKDIKEWEKKNAQSTANWRARNAAAQNRIRAAATSLGMNTADFYRLMETFYVADVGAYPELQDSVLDKEVGGKFVIHSQGEYLALAQDLASPGIPLLKLTGKLVPKPAYTPYFFSSPANQPNGPTVLGGTGAKPAPAPAPNAPAPAVRSPATSPGGTIDDGSRRPSGSVAHPPTEIKPIRISPYVIRL